MKYFLARLSVCALLVMLASTPAWAQDSALTGTVADPTGAIVPAAEVSITNQATGAIRKATTGSDGKYIFPQVSPGTYKVEVKATGFKTAQKSDIMVAVGQTTTFNIALTVGAVAETVVVESETSRINTTDASLGKPFSGDMVGNLPSLSLDPAGLLSLQAGVTFVPGQSDVAGGYSGTTDFDGRGGSVNGSRSDQTNITLDGVDVNDPQFGFAFTSVLRATQASLQEFRVTTTNYNADQGRSSAAQVQLVTKSGTNEFHGSAYWAHRNEAFNANDFFSNRDGVEKGKFRRHIYGASAGGPLAKDRLFIFGNWEELRENLTQGVLRSVPSDSFRDGVLIYECAGGMATCPGGTVMGLTGTHTVPVGFYGLTPAELAAIDPLNMAGEGVNLSAIAHFNQYPRSNAPGTFDVFNIAGFNFNAPVENFFRTYIVRLDYNLDRNANHTLYWRGTLQDDNLASAAQFCDQATFGGCLPNNTTSVSNNKGFALGYRALLTPAVVNSFRWGYTRIGEQTIGQQDSEFIRFRFLSDLNDYASNTLGRKVPQHHFKDDVSWSRGTHTMGFGGDIRITRNERFSNGNSFHFFSGNPSWLPNVGRNLRPGNSRCQQPGCFAVPAVASSGAAAYNDSVVNLLGIITQATGFYNLNRDGSPVPSGEPLPRRFGVNEYELYFQDQWRARKDLTLTFGVRYLIISPPFETEGRQVAPTLVDPATGQPVSGGLNEWFEIRRQLMLAGIGTNKAPQVAFDLGGPKNNGADYYPYDYNNWSPRLAAAWTPSFREGILGWMFGDGKTVFRAGYSLVYDRVGNGLITSFDDAGSFGLSTNIDSLFGGCGEGASTAGPLGVCPRFTGDPFDTSAASVLLPPAPCPSGFPCLPPGANALGSPQFGSFAITSALDNGITTPYSHTINVSIGRELPGNLNLEVAYVGRRGRDLLMIRDLAMPADIVDPASGVSYFQAAQQLLAMADQGTSILNLQPVPFWENLFPTFGPSSFNAGFLVCDLEGVDPGFAGGFSATQVAYDWLLCLHPDTTAFPWSIDGAGDLGFFGFPFVPGTVRGGPTDPDLDGDGIPDAPFSFFDDQFATLTAWSSIAKSEYHGLQLSLRKRLSGGFGFDFNYTLAKSLDHSSTPERAPISFGFFTGGYTGSAINSWEPDLEYSYSDFDMRHQINANWIWEVPIGHGRRFGSGMHGFWDAIVGGWQFSGIFRANSGLPANVINARVWPTNWNLQGNATCGDSSTFTNVARCPAVQNVSNAVHTQSMSAPVPNLFRDPDAAFDGFRFTLPGQRGERNILRGDKYINWDFSIGKIFRITENQRLEFRWEMFNAFNQVYFDTASLSASIGTRSTFGDYTAVLGGPRRMQASLRFEF